jgi:hypothetical protein
MYLVKIAVARREFEKGKDRTYDFEFDAEVNIEVPTKYSLFINCLKQFGRCSKRVPMGWRFERIETFADGSSRWVEYDVQVVAGAQPDPGFHLVREEA